MGTRHLICVVCDADYKVAQYGQWDGYPEGAGTDILNFIATHDMAAFETRVRALTWATETEIQDAWVACGAARASEFVPYEIAVDFSRRFPAWSRDTSAAILELIATGEATKLRNSINFAADSLFCEWCYVINLDTNELEVYSGFNKKPLVPQERFYTLDSKDCEYHPVHHLVTYGFEELPDSQRLALECNAIDNYLNAH